MNLSNITITKEEYFNRFGENLDLLLYGFDNPSDAAELFLGNVQETLNDFISANFNLDLKVIFNNMTDVEKTLYKEACLEQAKYTMVNSDLLNDTAYDNRSGIIADKSIVNRLAISPKAKHKLITCGIWDRTNSNYRRGRWYGLRLY